MPAIAGSGSEGRPIRWLRSPNDLRKVLRENLGGVTEEVV